MQCTLKATLHFSFANVRHYEKYLKLICDKAILGYFDFCNGAFAIAQNIQHNRIANAKLEHHIDNMIPTGYLQRFFADCCGNQDIARFKHAFGGRRADYFIVFSLNYYFGVFLRKFWLTRSALAMATRCC